MRGDLLLDLYEICWIYEANYKDEDIHKYEVYIKDVITDDDGLLVASY